VDKKTLADDEIQVNYIHTSVANHRPLTPSSIG